MKAKVIEYVVYAGGCCHFGHPLTERPLPLGAPLHVQVGVEQDEVEIPLQEIQAALSQEKLLSAGAIFHGTLVLKPNKVYLESVNVKSDIKQN